MGRTSKQKDNEPVAGLAAELAEAKAGLLIEKTGREEAVRFGLATRTIQALLHSTPNFAENVQSALTEASNAIGSETAALSLHEKGRWTVAYVHGFPKEVVGTEMENQQEPHAVLAISTGEPVAIDDTLHDPRVNRQHMAEWGVRSVLVVPVMSKQDAVGVFFFNFHKRPFSFREPHLEFARNLASSMSLALDNTRLLEGLRTSLSTGHEEMELKLAETERREYDRAEEVAALFDAIPTPVFIAHDPDCLHIEGNKAANELLRMSYGSEASFSAPPERRPRHFRVFRNGQELSNDELPAQRAARGFPVKGFDFDLVFDDGSVRQVVGYGTPLRDREGNSRGSVLVLVDATERKKAEEALKRAHAELELRVRERTTRLEEANDLLRQEMEVRKRAEEEIRLRMAIMETVGEGIFLIGAGDNIIKWTNSKFEKMFGYEPGGMVGMLVDRLNAPTDRSPAETRMSIVNELLRDGEWHGEVENIKKDGTRFWCYANASLFDHPELGKVIVSTHTDITEGKAAEKALRESEEKYRRLFAIEKDALFFIDKETGSILDVNDHACLLYGYTQDEMRRMRHVDVSADPEATLKAIGDARERIEPGFHRKKDGTVFPVDIAAAHFVFGGHPVMLGAVRDITERVKTEEALKSSLREKEALLVELRKFKTLAEASSEAIAISDHEGRLVYVNRSHERLFGRSLQEASRLNYRELYPPESVEILDRVVAPALARGEGWEGELDAFDVDGRRFPLWERADSVLDEKGVMLFAFGIMHDATARKQAEEELKGHRDRLEELVKERTSDLEAKSRELEGFNSALKVLLRQREEDRKDLEDRLISNVQDLIVPYMTKLKKCSDDSERQSLLNVVQSSLGEIISPFLRNLNRLRLTPRETEVAVLVKNGRSTKEIAEILRLAPSTVESCRKRIRNRLKLTQEKINLQAYLRSLD